MGRQPQCCHAKRIVTGGVTPLVRERSGCRREISAHLPWHAAYVCLGVRSADEPICPARRAAGAAHRRRAGRARAIELQGRTANVLLLVALCVVTLGLYPGIWYVRRARFVDALDANKRIGRLPWVSLGLLVVLIVVSAAGTQKDVFRLIQLLSGLVNMFLAFRIAAILRSDFARTGRVIVISTLGVFFFGCLYLQHVLNEAANVPSRRPRQSDGTSVA